MDEMTLLLTLLIKNKSLNLKINNLNLNISFKNLI